MSDKLQQWFSLSYESWLTLPRVLLEDMPEEWQDKFADLLFEYSDTFVAAPEVSVFVQLKKNNKYHKVPDWLCDYRRPNKEIIRLLKQHNVNWERYGL